MRASLLCVLVLFGCDGAAPAIDAGPSDAGPPPVCDDPDRACPSGAPVWGGPCEGPLMCPYEVCGPESSDIYECVGGEWTLTMPGGCAGFAPPLAETCSDPFEGTIDGARVWISEDRPGAPEIEDGATIEKIFGGQGLAMVPYRVHIDGADVPSCARVTTVLTLDGTEGGPAPHDVRFRCAETLRVQDILPINPCEMRDYPVTIEVTVEGVGSVTRNLTIAGGMCPRKMG
jgi:hypothetical protein